MSLNCKDGDWTRVIHPGDCYGRLQRVYGFFHDREGDACWRVDPPMPPFTGFLDTILEPIGNPPDDAVDSRDIKLGEAMRTQVREGARA